MDVARNRQSISNARIVGRRATRAQRWQDKWEFHELRHGTSANPRRSKALLAERRQRRTHEIDRRAAYDLQRLEDRFARSIDDESEHRLRGKAFASFRLRQVRARAAGLHHGVRDRHSWEGRRNES